MKENKIVATLWRWVKRAFWGAGKEISEDDKFVVEKIKVRLLWQLRRFSVVSLL